MAGDGIVAYYFKVTIEKENGKAKVKQGTIPAQSPALAMDILEGMVETWKAQILHVELNEINANGELVLRTVKDPGPTTPKTQASYSTGYSVRWTQPTFPILKLEDTK